MNRKSLVTALGALVMVVFAATAFAQVRYAHVGTLGVTSVKIVVPVRTLPLRDLHNLNLPPILRRILGNKVFSAQYIESLRQKLIRMGYLQPLPARYTIHNNRMTPAMSQAPQVVDRAIQSNLRVPAKQRHGRSGVPRHRCFRSAQPRSHRLCAVRHRHGHRRQ